MTFGSHLTLTYQHRQSVNTAHFSSQGCVRPVSLVLWNPRQKQPGYPFPSSEGLEDFGVWNPPHFSRHATLIQRQDKLSMQWVIEHLQVCREKLRSQVFKPSHGPPPDKIVALGYWWNIGRRSGLSGGVHVAALRDFSQARSASATRSSTGGWASSTFAENALRYSTTFIARDSVMPRPR